MEMDVVVSTNTGLERWLIEELWELGYKGEKLKPGKVIVKKVKGEDVVRLNFFLRIADRVFVKIAEGQARGLEDIYNIARRVSYSLFIRPDQSFAVRGIRVGKHSFTSVDMAGVVGRAIIDSYMTEKGVRLKVNLDFPDVEFYAELSNEDFLLLINTSGEGLHKRYPRVFQHFAPIKPTIASALIRISSFRKRGELFDPMAGGGTIPIEASLMEKNVPPVKFRRDYAFRNLSFIPEVDYSWEERECKSYIVAADLYEKNYVGMQENARAVGVERCISFFKGDARKMDYIKDPPRLVITNPPYGLRIASKKVIRDLYQKFAEKCYEKGIEEIVVLTAEGMLMKKMLEKVGFETSFYHRVLYGSLPTRIIRSFRG